MKRGTPERLADNAVNDADKEITIVTSEAGFELRSVYVELVTGATVGNRHLCMTVKDQAGNVVFYAEQPHDQAALSTHYYLFGAGIAMDSSIATYDYIGIPAIVIPNGYTLRAFDASVVAVGSDDMKLEVLGLHL